MLIEYIEWLRTQPKEVREHAVYFWTAVLVGVIVLLYIVYLIVSPSWRDTTPDTGAIAAPYESVNE